MSVSNVLVGLAVVDGAAPARRDRTSITKELNSASSELNSGSPTKAR
jgi:hypothetical protein